METFFAYMEYPLSGDWASLLIRLAIGIALLPYGIKKLREPGNAAKFPKVFIFSPKVAYFLAMLVETIVPVCLILGLCTRAVAIPGIVNMGVATKVSMGPYFTSPALVFLLGLIAIACIGAGTYSLDYVLMGAGLQ